MDLGEFFTQEAGRARRNWLDDKERQLQEAAQYYLGPTGVVDNINAVNELFNPVIGMRDMTTASQGLMLPDITPQERLNYGVQAGAEALGILAPTAAFKMVGDASKPVAPVVAESLSGLSVPDAGPSVPNVPEAPVQNIPVGDIPANPPTRTNAEEAIRALRQDPNVDLSRMTDDDIVEFFRQDAAGLTADNMIDILPEEIAAMRDLGMNPQNNAALEDLRGYANETVPDDYMDAALLPGNDVNAPFDEGVPGDDQLVDLDDIEWEAEPEPWEGFTNHLPPRDAPEAPPPLREPLEIARPSLREDVPAQGTGKGGRYASADLPRFGPGKTRYSEAMLQALNIQRKKGTRADFKKELLKAGVKDEELRLLGWYKEGDESLPMTRDDLQKFIFDGYDNITNWGTEEPFLQPETGTSTGTVGKGRYYPRREAMDKWLADNPEITPRVQKALAEELENHGRVTGLEKASDLSPLDRETLKEYLVSEDLVENLEDAEIEVRKMARRGTFVPMGDVSVGLRSDLRSRSPEEFYLRQMGETFTDNHDNAAQEAALRFATEREYMKVPVRDRRAYAERPEGEYFDEGNTLHGGYNPTGGRDYTETVYNVNPALQTQAVPESVAHVGTPYTHDVHFGGDFNRGPKDRGAAFHLRYADHPVYNGRDFEKEGSPAREEGKALHFYESQGDLTQHVIKNPIRSKLALTFKGLQDEADRVEEADRAMQRWKGGVDDVHAAHNDPQATEADLRAVEDASAARLEALNEVVERKVPGYSGGKYSPVPFTETPEAFQRESVRAMLDLAVSRPDITHLSFTRPDQATENSHMPPRAAAQHYGGGVSGAFDKELGRLGFAPQPHPAKFQMPAKDAPKDHIGDGPTVTRKRLTNPDLRMGVGKNEKWETVPGVPVTAQDKERVLQRGIPLVELSPEQQNLRFGAQDWSRRIT